VTEGVPNVVVDYTPEVLKAYIAQQAKLQYTNVLERLESAAHKDFQKVVPGVTVKVTGGKPKSGVVVGKEYKAFHVMSRSYGMGYRAVERPIAGVALDDEKQETVAKNGKTYQSYKNVAWVWCHNLEVVGAEAEFEKYMPTMIAQAKQAMTARVTELLNKFSKQNQKAA
jgi:phospholipase/lecithinase/hemolysin